MRRRELVSSLAALAGTRVFRAEAVSRAQAKSAVTTRDGAQLFCRSWGTGRPIVFVHAWALHSDFFEYAMLRLVAEGFRAVAYDRRGHGRSSDPGGSFDCDLLADDLHTVIDGLDLRGITLVGHSMGGGEVIRYLSRHGASRVARAVLIAPTAPLIVKAPDHPEGVERAAFDALRAALLKDRAKWVADNFAGFWGGFASPEIVEWGQRMPLQCSLKTMIESTRLMSETDLRSDLRRITVPTLVVHGTADRSIPVRFGRATASLLPTGRIEEYEGAPHGLPVTHVERLVKDVAAFVGA